MDVTGLYTNIDNTEGLEAMREALEESSQNQKPSANFDDETYTDAKQFRVQQCQLPPKNGDGNGNKGRSFI